MTRALGHSLLADFGVVPTPAVAGLRALDSSAACLVLASDGVWDAMSPAEAVRFVMHAVDQARFWTPAPLDPSTFLPVKQLLPAVAGTRTLDCSAVCLVVASAACRLCVTYQGVCFVIDTAEPARLPEHTTIHD